MVQGSAGWPTCLSIGRIYPPEMHPSTQRWCTYPVRNLLSSRSTARQWVSSCKVNGIPLWLARRKHHASWHKVEAIVVGGGPAGIAAVGNLLDYMPTGKVVWIDRSFKGGSIGQLYRELPSYSPATDFLKYAHAVRTFTEICDAAAAGPKGPQPNAITSLEELQRGSTFPLSYAANMLRLISDGLRQHPRVESIVGFVTDATRNPKSKKWTISTLPQGGGINPSVIKRTAPLVVYCTGTHPKTELLPLEVERLPLNVGFAPSRLAKLLAARSGQPTTVAVIGDCPSAVIVLVNLFYIASTSHPQLRIRWFTRGAAAADQESSPSGVSDDNSTYAGLRRAVAAEARTHRDGDPLDQNTDAVITRFIYPSNPSAAAAADDNDNNNPDLVPPDQAEREALRRYLPGVDFVFQAIGYTRNRLPKTRMPGHGRAGKRRQLVFNPETGAFYTANGLKDGVIGLFGAGSAFAVPEGKMPITGDGSSSSTGGSSSSGAAPAGEQGAQQGSPVTVWGVMRFLRRAVPRWLAAVEKGHNKITALER
ncbi:hypothetical protein VTK56DRAFT_9588 [Thermocarpiscus australiensis]